MALTSSKKIYLPGKSQSAILGLRPIVAVLVNLVVVVRVGVVGIIIVVRICVNHVGVEKSAPFVFAVITRILS